MFQKIIILLALTAFVSCRPSDGSSRILGGNQVFFGEIPYQASIQAFDTQHHLSGGVLLNSRWVLTTAHTIINRAATSLNIFLGIIRLDDPSTVPFRSAEIRRHPQFSSFSLVNNIALIRSATVINFTSFIMPIDLSPTFLGAGAVARVSGWGAINEDKTGDSITLRRVEVTTRACVNTQFQSFSNDHVCAGAANTSAPQVGICTRDIGGPLVMNSVLVGIAFYHDPRFCGVNPDGYVRISTHRSWILGNIPV